MELVKEGEEEKILIQKGNEDLDLKTVPTIKPYTT